MSFGSKKVSSEVASLADISFPAAFSLRLSNLYILADKLFIDAGGGDDVITIDALRGNGTVLGGPGNDKLLVDTRYPSSGDTVVNTLDGSSLLWNGGGGNDTVEIYFVSTGTTHLNKIGDSDGVNNVTASCMNGACTILSSHLFETNLLEPGLSYSTTLECINLEAGSTNTNIHFDKGEPLCSSGMAFNNLIHLYAVTTSQQELASW
jgi:Ca2+-binding RTX toxin-like protein